MKVPASQTATFENVVYYTLTSVLSHIYGNQSARDITEICSVNVDAWYYGVSVACDAMEFGSVLLSTPLVWFHSTRPSWAMWLADACTDIQQVA